MKRRLLILLLLLVGGAIVNVAVAWGLAAYAPLVGRHQHRFDERPLTAEEAAWSSGGRLHEMTAAGFSFVLVRADNGFDSRVQTGWPVTGLRSTKNEQGCDGIIVHPRPYSDAQNEVSFLWEPRFLPTRPICPGFAINTVFYAMVLWLMFAGPFVVRRWRRIRRGLCPKCAYDLRGSAGGACPECGATR